MYTHICNTIINYRRPFGVEQEFFVQLFVEHDPNLRLPYVGDLLRKMLLEQHISFTKVPFNLCTHYASRCSRTRDTVKLTVCVYSSCNCSTVAMRQKLTASIGF